MNNTICQAVFLFYSREQRAKWLLADIWRLPRGSNTPLLCSAASLIPRCLQRGLWLHGKWAGMKNACHVVQWSCQSKPVCKAGRYLESLKAGKVPERPDRKRILSDQAFHIRGLFPRMQPLLFAWRFMAAIVCLSVQKEVSIPHMKWYISLIASVADVPVVASQFGMQVFLFFIKFWVDPVLESDLIA